MRMNTAPASASGTPPPYSSSVPEVALLQQDRQQLSVLVDDPEDLVDVRGDLAVRLEVFVHHQAVTLGVAVLRHQDQRRRVGGDDVESEVQQDERVWIPAPDPADHV